MQLLQSLHITIKPHTVSKFHFRCYFLSFSSFLSNRTEKVIYLPVISPRCSNRPSNSSASSFTIKR